LKGRRGETSKRQNAKTQGQCGRAVVEDCASSRRSRGLDDRASAPGGRGEYRAFRARFGGSRLAVRRVWRALVRALGSFGASFGELGAGTWSRNSLSGRRLSWIPASGVSWKGRVFTFSRFRFNWPPVKWQLSSAGGGPRAAPPVLGPSRSVAAGPSHQPALVHLGRGIGAALSVRRRTRRAIAGLGWGAIEAGPSAEGLAPGLEVWGHPLVPLRGRAR
jgi:hypothetical protein